MQSTEGSADTGWWVAPLLGVNLGAGAALAWPARRSRTGFDPGDDTATATRKGLG